MLHFDRLAPIPKRHFSVLPSAASFIRNASSSVRARASQEVEWPEPYLSTIPSIDKRDGAHTGLKFRRCSLK